jgi:Histidine kinase-, DNA gyrase B-, and HSP90-like ATPase
MAGWRLPSAIRNLLRKETTPCEVPPKDSSGAEPPAKACQRNPLATAAAIWIEEAHVTGRKRLPPDPGVMRAIGLNHTLESAVADIIDNSLDAQAGKVLVRFIRSGHRLIGLCIVDDGKGMDEPTIDRAMTVGGQRNYDATDLGHFGMGLKAASLGQARILTVISKARHDAPVGRRWLIENAAQSFECEILARDTSASILARPWRFLIADPGTVVMWNEVKCFPHIADSEVADQFVEDMVTRLRHHLGLVFHRLLSGKVAEIAVDVEDIATGEAGVCFLVEPINPFGYLRSGRTDYPRDLVSPVHGIKFRCHIWPGRSNHPNFRLLGARPEQFQGFYFYRNNRLLQHGGWNGVTHNHRRLQLARVEVDIVPRHIALFSMNAEKTRVEVPAAFNDMIQTAIDGSTSFVSYLEHARTTFRGSQMRQRERSKVLQPGRGFAERVRDAIADEYDYVDSDRPLSIRWCDLNDEVFFDIDREEMMIRLNRKYRAAVIGGNGGSLNDAPLIKALVYLLSEQSLHGSFLGARERDNLSIWQSILTAAAQLEKK